LTAAEKIIRGVVQADERSRQSADAARQSDAVLALLMQFQVQVNGVFGIVLLDVSGLIDFQFIKILQLVKALQTELPGATVVNATFFERQFAADDLVSGGGVAGELDTPHGVLRAFVDVNLQADQLLGVVNLRLWNSGELDVTQSAGRLGQLIQPLADFAGVKDIAVFHGEGAAQGFFVVENLV